MSRVTAIGICGFLALGCKVQASANANIDAGAAEAEGSVTANGSQGSTAYFAVKIRREGDLLVHEDGEINFATDEATLVGEQTESTLEAYARVLQEHPEVHLRIEGHTDSRASDEHNRQLSDDRAKAVRQWLVEEAEIEEDRLTAVGHGEGRPQVPEPDECKNKRASTAPEWCDERVWSRNRRSEFHITAGAESLPDGKVIVNTGPDGKGSSGAGPRSGPYVYLSPAFVRVPVADRDETDARGTSYRWGLGAGYLWRRNRFITGLGLGFAHIPVTIDTGSERCMMLRCLSAHELVFNTELRIGGGSPRVVGYGLLGPGLVLGRSRRTDDVTEVRFTTGGFNFDLGAGVWGWVWRGLFLGGEVALNVGAYTGDVSAFHDGARVTGLDLRFLLGWHFGR